MALDVYLVVIVCDKKDGLSRWGRQMEHNIEGQSAAVELVNNLQASGCTAQWLKQDHWHTDGDAEYCPECASDVDKFLASRAGK